MKTIITTKQELPSVVEMIHKSIDKAVNQMFGDWTTFSSPLEYE